MPFLLQHYLGYSAFLYEFQNRQLKPHIKQQQQKHCWKPGITTDAYDPRQRQEDPTLEASLGYNTVGVLHIVCMWYVWGHMYVYVV